MTHLPVVFCHTVLVRSAFVLGCAAYRPSSTALVALVLAWAGCSEAALPEGAQVVKGNALVTLAGKQMTIEQNSDKAIIDWQSFNIGADHEVRFEQPIASSMVLNRVTGANASEIHGQLNANGRVFLLNPNGVLFGPGARVDVGSLVASTLAISNDNFLEENCFGETYHFEGQGRSVAGREVVNQGSINVSEGGAVALLGGRVRNNGQIVARLGSVVLAAGNEVTLEFAGDGFLRFEVKKSALNALVENHRLIAADGGLVIMQAKATDALLQTVVNNTGVIQARTVQNNSGVIILKGGLSGGKVQVSGALDASALGAGNGGVVLINGTQVQIFDDAQVTTQAVRGKTGNWHIASAADFTIGAGSAFQTDGIGAVTLMSHLATSSVFLQTTAGRAGAIHVNAPLSWGQNTLSLSAQGDINVNAVMTVNGTAGLEINYGGYSADQRTSVEGHGINMAVANSRFIGRVDFSDPNGLVASTSPLRINGDYYTILSRLGSPGSTTGRDLQGINGGLNAKYALGADINAGTTGVWNDKQGFEPIGISGTPFTGQIEGLGHQISELFIQRPDKKNVGLFGYSQGKLGNLGVVGGKVRGGDQTGSLVGSMSGGSLRNAFATGHVSGHKNTGGLVGYMHRGSINSAFTTARVNGSKNIGGLIGHMYWGSIDHAYATGDVFVDFPGKSGGGLVGRQQRGSIDNVYATGNVTGFINTGGLVGRFEHGRLVNGYATGKVIGQKETTGGLVGLSDGGSVRNAYWSIESTGQKFSADGKGLTMAQIFASHQWAGFDFVSVWGNGNQQTTPYLRNMGGNQVFNKNALPTSFTTRHPALYTVVLDLPQLQAVQNKLDGLYLLGNDIDASATKGWNDGQGFVPIGSADAPFFGKFDGLGHTINDLVIDRPEQVNVGLLGVSSAVLRNLGIQGGSVTGADNTGSLVGRQAGGRINDVYATGSVTGRNRTGGLVGEMHNSITSNAYATGNVTGDTYIGGLVGVQTHGCIINAYATGKVIGRNAPGGLIGGMSDSSVRNAYWNIETTGQMGSAGGKGLSTEQMFDSRQWDGFDFASVWGNGNQQTTPYLRNMLGNQVFNKNDLPASVTAISRPALYSTIIDAHQLQAVQKKLGGLYLLGNDIDASQAKEWNDGQGFKPIGSVDAPFTGQFDGLGHKISNLNIYRPEQADVGLFAASRGGLRNLGMQGGCITGADKTGSLVGFMVGGSISNAYALVNVTGGNHTGGLVGYMKNSSIRRAYATGVVTSKARSYGVGGLLGSMHNSSISNAYATGRIFMGFSGQACGGLVGWQKGGNISNVYATGEVTGWNLAGGLVGRQDEGSLSNAYATGSVIGNQHTGGLVGGLFNGSIYNAYWNIQTTGQKDSAGGKGLSTEQMFDARQWGDFDFVSVWGNDKQQTTPYLLNMTRNQVSQKNELLEYVNATKYPKPRIPVVQQPVKNKLGGFYPNAMARKE